jgi:hypothetical protein
MLTQEQINIIDGISTGMAILEGLDEAIMGYDAASKKIIYDYSTVIEILVEGGMSEYDAIEYVEYNIVPMKLTNDEGVDITPILFNEFPTIDEFDDIDSEEEIEEEIEEDEENISKEI